MTETKRIGITLSGASGSILALQALRILKDYPSYSSHLIITDGGRKTAELELSANEQQELSSLADQIYEESNLAAPIASGSNALDAMLIAPCSIRSLSAIAYYQTDRLSTRAADVMLKERRPLVLMVRESPLHAGHLKAMSEVTQMGGIIAPPVPAFYLKPLSIEDMTFQMAARALQLCSLSMAKHLKKWENPNP